MTNQSSEESIGSGEQSGMQSAPGYVEEGVSDAGSAIEHELGHGSGGTAGTVEHDAETAGSGVVTGVDDAEAGVASFLGGGLEKAYLLILPSLALGEGPIGTAAMAAEVAAAIATQDVAGSAASDNDVEAIEAQTLGIDPVRLDFMFNPTHYSISKSASWDHSPSPGAIPTSTPMWNGSNQRVLTVECFVDRSMGSSGSVQGTVDLLFATMQPTRVSLVPGPPLPPAVIFGWGENITFLAYMDNVSVEYTHFRFDGTPIRAACTLNLKEIPVSLPGQNPTSGGTARSTRQILAGDSLASVSNRELGKPTLWRAIAATNDIEDPTRVPVGTNLLIPTRTDAAEIG